MKQNLSTTCIGIVVIALMASGAAAQTSRVFISKNPVPMPTGPADATATCNTLASNESLGGTWVAWLSDSSTDAVDQLTLGSGPFNLVGSGTKIADDIADLTDSSIDAIIDRAEDGSAVAGQFTWTGTSPDGTAYTVTCDDWTNTATNGMTGHSGFANDDWTFFNNANCATTRGLYCFEVFPASVPAASSAGIALLAGLMLGGSLYLRRRKRTA